MESLIPRSLIAVLPETPIPSLTLSAVGLIVLADLDTIPRRTALTGGSSWLDALVLAPGLHYQQAADELDRSPAVNKLGDVFALDLADVGKQTRQAINNLKTVQFLMKLYKEGAIDPLAFEIEMPKSDELATMLRKIMGRERKCKKHDEEEQQHNTVAITPDINWFSHFLYLVTPVLTTAALTMTVLIGDYWTMSFILALILSRILNIWAIKHRCAAPTSLPFSPPQISEYIIDLGLDRNIRLRGLNADLQAITAQAWMRAQTNLDGYLEAMAKLLVYLVAAFSGNSTQMGAIVMMALLLISAGLLGLSNAQSQGSSVHGRFAKPYIESVKADNLSGSRTGFRFMVPGVDAGEYHQNIDQSAGYDALEVV